jgi:uncharacterized protein YjbI with pentapeptide repeats
MKFAIKNRWTSAVQFEAEIECCDDVPLSIKMGLSLKWAYKTGADLEGADLKGADLKGANLEGADLKGAYLKGAYLENETFEKYLTEVVPALLTAGGKTLQQIRDSKCFDCHTWTNCPMHVAFDIENANDGPILLRPRIKEFVRMFDQGLIPVSVLDEKVVT